uniref:DUF4150 domain-containing protein n=1 Tax=Panagrellus redivivus TaxID=6233 RepID=A0A7E4VUR8_PANRE
MNWTPFGYLAGLHATFSLTRGSVGASEQDHRKPDLDSRETAELAGPRPGAASERLCDPSSSGAGPSIPTMSIRNQEADNDDDLQVRTGFRRRHCQKEPPVRSRQTAIATCKVDSPLKGSNKKGQYLSGVVIAIRKKSVFGQTAPPEGRRGPGVTSADYRIVWDSEGDV